MLGRQKWLNYCTFCRHYATTSSKDVLFCRESCVRDEKVWGWAGMEGRVSTPRYRHSRHTASDAEYREYSAVEVEALTSLQHYLVPRQPSSIHRLFETFTVYRCWLSPARAAWVRRQRPRQRRWWTAWTWRQQRWRTRNVALHNAARSVTAADAVWFREVSQMERLCKLLFSFDLRNFP